MGGRSEVQGYPQLHTELEAILSCVRSMLKRESKIYVKENENEREEERTREAALSIIRFSSRALGFRRAENKVTGS